MTTNGAFPTAWPIPPRGWARSYRAMAHQAVARRRRPNTPDRRTLPELRRQPFANQRRDELAHVAIQPGDFLDQLAGNRLVVRISHQEHRLDAVVERAVHADHLEFIFEIRHRPQPPDNQLGTH